MSRDKPRIYIFHGDDEYAIARDVAEFESNLGEQALKEANLTRLDGGSFNLDGLIEEVSPMPFLVERRIVVLEDALSRFDPPRDGEDRVTKAQREALKEKRRKFTGDLEKVPATTALVLVEHKFLPDGGGGRGYAHWLLEWAEKHPDIVYIKSFLLPGRKMDQWIMSRAVELGGQIEPSAAVTLAGLVGDDTRLADQELGKLLDYVDYSRPVSEKDVQELTVDSSLAGIFDMVDAVGLKKERDAMLELRHLLEQQDHSFIFAMVIRQFRFLILTREILDKGGGEPEVSEQLRFLQTRRKRRYPLPGWMARKFITQARRFSLPELEGVYRRLLVMDEEIKTSRATPALALDLFVSEISA
ncbi:MAG: DNA polymerase III subunit delta [Anaerolineales bacterium]|jgi:DNA polymerase-3 subunit delta